MFKNRMAESGHWIIWLFLIAIIITLESAFLQGASVQLQEITNNELLNENSTESLVNDNKTSLIGYKPLPVNSSKLLSRRKRTWGKHGRGGGGGGYCCGQQPQRVEVIPVYVVSQKQPVQQHPVCCAPPPRPPPPPPPQQPCCVQQQPCCSSGGYGKTISFSGSGQVSW